MPHISFSALKNWDFCPYYHKLTYLDRVKLFKGNVYTAFGSALHTACEKLLLKEDIDHKKVFSEAFVEEINKITIETDKERKMMEDMKPQGIELAALILESLEVKFPGYKVVSAEEEIFEKVEDIEMDYDFKGFLDLVIQTPDGKYHIIDWKSCSWGWDIRRKTDKMVTYQLTYYKNFFCSKHNIDPQMAETYFGLLKRTAKKNRVEIFRVSSGQKKTNNSLKVLNKAVYNIHHKNHPKNRLSCNKCEFYKTEWCP